MVEVKMVDSVVIKRTQDTLGKFIKKPPMTEKLLQKPPFRFIHDVICVVIKETGFLKGLFTAEELNSNNYKDRDAKMQFLQKLIDVIKIITQEEVTAKPSKIVAGQEADKTNELFCIIGKALHQKVDSKKGVEEYKQRKKNEKVKDPKKAEKIKQTPSRAPKEKVGSEKPNIKENVKGKPKNSQNKQTNRIDSGIIEDLNESTHITEKQTEEENSLLHKEIKLEKTNTNIDIVEEKDTKTRNEIERKNEENETKLNITENNSNPEKEELKSSNNLDSTVQLNDEKKMEDNSGKIAKADQSDILLDSIKDKNSLDKTDALVGNEKDTSISNIKTKINSKKQQKSENTEKSKVPPVSLTKQKPLLRPRTSLRPPSRPASARVPAPRRLDKNIEIVLADETIRLGDISVKLEQFNFPEKDDDENLIVVEDGSEMIMPEVKSDELIVTTDDVNQGHLIKQILETQKDLIGQKSTENISQSTSGNQNFLHVTELQNHIQKLTKSVQPLGKFIDFLLEDVDSMLREYSMWSEKEIQMSNHVNRDSDKNLIQSLKHQLEDVLDKIKEQHSIVDGLRNGIIVNEEKLMNLYRF